MGSYNAFGHAVVDGEVTSYQEFFWFFVTRNRRDEGPTSPIVMYAWDENYEIGEIKKAEDELRTFVESSEELIRDMYETSKASVVQDKKEYRGRTDAELLKITTIMRQAQEDLDRGVPEPLRDILVAHIKTFEGDIEFNSKLSRSSDSSYPDFLTWKTWRKESYERGVQLAKERYAERKARCEKTQAFMAAAIETYGPPPVGIDVRPSSKMY